jgi:hypothetical protein
VTPIEKLQEAVQQFVAEVDGDEAGMVTAFILGYECTRFTDEPGMDARVAATDYTTGPGTTLTTAVGLNIILGRYLDDALDGAE